MDLKELFTQSEDFFSQPRCIFCKCDLDHGGVCLDCLMALPYHKGIIKGGEFFTACAAPLYYDGVVRQALTGLKFRQARYNAVVLAGLLARTVKKELDGRYDVITWVPVSLPRRLRRGFDQARLIAEEMGKELGETPVKLLKKTRHTKANSALVGRDKRSANVAGAYTVGAPELCRGKRVLLVDDIYTTGATFSECARMLLMAGAVEVVCAAAAVTPKKKRT